MSTGAPNTCTPSPRQPSRVSALRLANIFLEDIDDSVAYIFVVYNVPLFSCA